MASFWIVENGIALEHVGRPTRAGNTSFAVGSTDADYLAAGLFKHVNWEGTYNPRTQELSPPRFVVRSDLKEVQTMYDVWEKTPEQIAAHDAEQTAGLKSGMIQAIQNMLDQAAQAKGYDSIISACSYAAGGDTLFAREGRAFLAWREAVWLKAYEILAAVEGGQRAVPTVEVLLSEMPVLVLPS